MKNFVKYFSFVLVSILAVTFVGCGNTPADNDVNIPELIASLLDETNFTMNIDVDYALDQAIGDAESTSIASGEMSGVQLLADGDNFRSYTPLDVDRINVDGYSYEREYDEGEWESGYSIYTSESEFGTELSFIFDILNEININVYNYDEDWFTVKTLDSGAYEITINADLASELTAYQDAIIDNKDATLGTLVNALLSVHYGSDFTVAKIVTDLKADITAQSTVGDLLDFIEDEFDMELSGILEALTTFSTEIHTTNFEMSPSTTDDEEEFSLEAILNANLYTTLASLMEQTIETDAQFDALIDTFVAYYLDDETITLSSLCANSESLTAMLAYLEAIEISDLQIDLVLTTDSAKAHLVSVEGSINGEVTVDQTTYTLEANLSIEISQIGTTSVNVPTITEIQYCSLEYNFVDGDLTENTSKVINNVNLGSINFTFVNYDSVEGATLVYNSTNKTLTLSSQAVDYIIQNGSTYFYDSENSAYVSFVLENTDL